MDIIDAKKNEIDSISRELVYDGVPSGHQWSSQATFITAQNRSVSAALEKVGRHFDNLYIKRGSGERWHLFSSKGKEGNLPVLFYFWYNNYGFKSYVYIGWEKFKTADIIGMKPAEMNALLTGNGALDLEKIWRKDRSIDVIGHALETLPRASVDAVIKKMAPKLIKNAAGQQISDKSAIKISSAISSLKRIDTAASNSLANSIEESFKKECMVAMLTSIRDHKSRSALPITALPGMITALRQNGLRWPELEVIKRSLNALRIDEDASDVTNAIRQADWVLSHNVPGGNYWAVGMALQDMSRAGVPLDKIKGVMEKHRKDIVFFLEDLLGGEMSTIQAGLSNLVDMQKHQIHWPELDGILDNNKHGIMKTVLWEIANGSEDMMDRYRFPVLYLDLVELGVDWSEMAVIQRSLDASKKVVKESKEEAEQYGYPASAVMDKIRDDHPLALYHGIQDLRYDGVKDSIILGALQPHDADIAHWMDIVLSDAPPAARVRQVTNFMMMGANWPKIKSAIEKHRDLIIRLLLEEYKQAIESTHWQSVNLSKLAGRMHLITQAGYDWPEIHTIEQSARSGNR